MDQVFGTRLKRLSAATVPAVKRVAISCCPLLGSTTVVRRNITRTKTMNMRGVLRLTTV